MMNDENRNTIEKNVQAVSSASSAGAEAGAGEIPSGNVDGGAQPFPAATLGGLTATPSPWSISINDCSPHGICVIHVLLNAEGKPYDWSFEYCNPSLARMFGSTPEELQGTRYFERFPNSRSIERAPHYYKAAYEGSYESFDVMLEEAGRVLRVEALPTGKTGYCMCILYDIQTELAEKERKNRELQAAYQQLSDERKVLDQLCTDYTAVYYVDLDTGSFQVWYVAGSSNARRIVGQNHQSFDDFSDAYLDAYFYPEARESFRNWLRVAHLREALKTKERLVDHYESVPTPNGQRYFEAQVVRTYGKDGRMYALIGFRCIDEIMEREVEMQNELKAALDEAQLRYEIISAIAKAYTTILRIDLPRDFTEVIAGEDFVRDFVKGENRASRVLQYLVDLTVAPEYPMAVRTFMDLSTLAARLEKEEVLDTEYKMTDGHWHRLSFLVKKRDEAGHVTHVVCAIRSISETKRRELNLVYMADAAKQESNMKSRFLSNMSHDIRTPLNGVIGLVNLASQYPENLEMLTKIRTKEKETLQYLVSLVNDILDMNKLESGEIEERELNFDLAEVLQELNQKAQQQASQKKIRYEVAWECGKIEHALLRGNPVYLGRVLNNITDNAIKFSTPGSYIRVSCQEREVRDGKVWLRFMCVDQGCGMTEETLHRVGMLFTQESMSSRTQYEGTGLGLAIVKKLVDRMGGTLHIESAVGIGTTVLVDLPFAMGEQTQIRREAKDIEQVSVEGLRALVVEDNELNMEIATSMLENAHMEVTEAADGQEALEIFEKSAPGYFSVIYMDLMMPRLGGLEATRAIRALKRRDARTIPIIAMSANAFADDIINCRLAGMNKHLAKPLDEERMVQALRECMSDGDMLKLQEDL
ncbi:MAG TPA: hybrid sensor histidine kinase/response regulator [Oribacterium sp.]|nr:hybrid sensor histidine kinase/response regulator [Oribacterium sp.]